MHGHIGDPVIAVRIDGHAMWHVEHVRAPAGLDGACLGIQHVDGLLLYGSILNQVVDVALIEGAASEGRGERQLSTDTPAAATAVDLLNIPIAVCTMKDDRIAFGIHRDCSHLPEAMLICGPVLHEHRHGYTGCWNGHVIVAALVLQRQLITRRQRHRFVLCERRRKNLKRISAMALLYCEPTSMRRLMSSLTSSKKRWLRLIPPASGRWLPSTLHTAPRQSATSSATNETCRMLH